MSKRKPPLLRRSLQQSQRVHGGDREKKAVGSSLMWTWPQIKQEMVQGHLNPRRVVCRILNHCWAVFLKKTVSWLWCQNSTCDWKSFFKVDFAWRERWSRLVPVIHVFLEFIFWWKPNFVDDMELCHCFYKFVNKFQYGKEFLISGFHVFYCFFVCVFFFNDL